MHQLRQRATPNLSNFTAACEPFNKLENLITSFLQVQNEDLTHEKLQIFNRLWSINFSGDSLLVFSTGRSPNLFCQLWVRGPCCMCIEYSVSCS
jgi:hypothetical protein